MGTPNDKGKALTERSAHGALRLKRRMSLITWLNRYCQAIDYDKHRTADGNECAPLLKRTT